MSSTAFSRARSEEQRAARAAAILEAADAMLRETTVGEISLNELSRRVGLAKSNVLRYFPSREAILLQLLDRETRAWLDDIESRSSEPLTDAIAAAAAARPVFCDLTASASGVLERNVSGEVAADYKRASLASSDRLARLAGFDGLESPGGLIFVGAVMLAIGGIWASSQPTEGMRAAYAQHPELRPFRIQFETAVRELVATTLAGLEARGLR
ncbi:TetR family transcriptional regulator [Leifsonia sp. NPDC077715]|uniref:TetR family transcriptional regulator n=1 Tax=Leifsonia sp. NPDC077715 TaxID=3155539 RepID=UPI0034254A1A